MFSAFNHIIRKKYFLSVIVASFAVAGVFLSVIGEKGMNIAGTIGTSVWEISSVYADETVPSEECVPGYGVTETMTCFVPNICGVMDKGVLQCDGTCGNVRSSLPVNFLNACVSPPNICGMTNSGTIGCSGACGAVPPLDSFCPPYCGDLICNGSETCSTCSTDCGACVPVCGDGTCNGSETCSTCPGDCGICAAAPTATLTVFPNPFTQGTNATFTYSSTNAVYCQVLIDSTTYIVNGYSTFGAVPYGSGLGVGLHTAAVQCYNAGWTGSGWTTVVFTVSAFVPPAPTVDLKINGSDGPVSMSLGDIRYITWSGITNATSCTASSSDGFNGSKSMPSGSENLPANTSSNHILTCSGPGGNTSDSVQVNLSCAASCGAWSSCSVTCGGGVESRSCVASNCSTYIDTQACNTAVCPNYNWKEVAP